MMNNKKRVTLGVKIYRLIIVLVFASATLSILAGYIEHTRTTDQFYKDLADNVAETVSNSLNGTQVKVLLDAAKDSEYREIYAQAHEKQDDSGIVDYLKRRDLLLTYDNLNEILVQYSRYMDVKYIYLQSLEDGVFVRVIDPDEGYLSYGYTDTLDGPFAQYSNRNVKIPASVSQTSDGLLCSCFEPVYDSEGTAVAVVGVDVSMDALQSKHRRFAVICLINALILSSVAAITGVFFMRRNVTRPIRELCTQTRIFTDKRGMYSKDDIIRIDFHSGDEIEDLYKETQDMEKKIVTYLEHLIKVTGEKERVRTELEIAAQIQEKMLPNHFPAFPDRHDFDLYALMDPAREVGGDFYDFYLLDDDHLVLTIADVSGKGVPASMFMSITKSLFKVIITPETSPAELMTMINNELCADNNMSDMFVSVWLGILELSTGVLTACNAGHEYPVLSRAGHPFEIFRDKHSLVMAAMSEIRYHDYQILLEPGDRLFVYTDGVVEATDPDNKLFGMDRMIEALNRVPDAGPEQLVREVDASIWKHVGSAPQFDDITMLSLIYTPGGSDRDETA